MSNRAVRLSTQLPTIISTFFLPITGSCQGFVKIDKNGNRWSVAFVFLSPLSQLGFSRCRRGCNGNEITIAFLTIFLNWIDSKRERGVHTRPMYSWMHHGYVSRLLQLLSLLGMIEKPSCPCDVKFGHTKCCQTLCYSFFSVILYSREII